jgi:hypothetical protein
MVGWLVGWVGIIPGMVGWVGGDHTRNGRYGEADPFMIDEEYVIITGRKESPA